MKYRDFFYDDNILSNFQWLLEFYKFSTEFGCAQINWFARENGVEKLKIKVCWKNCKIQTWFSTFSIIPPTNLKYFNQWQIFMTYFIIYLSIVTSSCQQMTIFRIELAGHKMIGWNQIKKRFGRILWIQANWDLSILMFSFTNIEDVRGSRSFRL